MRLERWWCQIQGGLECWVKEAGLVLEHDPPWKAPEPRKCGDENQFLGTLVICKVNWKVGGLAREAGKGALALSPA